MDETPPPMISDSNSDSDSGDEDEAIQQGTPDPDPATRRVLDAQTNQLPLSVLKERQRILVLLRNIFEEVKKELAKDKQYNTLWLPEQQSKDHVETQRIVNQCRQLVSEEFEDYDQQDPWDLETAMDRFDEVEAAVERLSSVCLEKMEKKAKGSKKVCECCRRVKVLHRSIAALRKEYMMTKNVAKSYKTEGQERSLDEILEFLGETAPDADAKKGKERMRRISEGGDAATRDSCTDATKSSSTDSRERNEEASIATKELDTEESSTSVVEEVPEKATGGKRNVTKRNASLQTEIRPDEVYGLEVKAVRLIIWHPIREYYFVWRGNLGIVLMEGEQCNFQEIGRGSVLIAAAARSAGFRLSIKEDIPLLYAWLFPRSRLPSFIASDGVSLGCVFVDLDDGLLEVGTKMENEELVLALVLSCNGKPASFLLLLYDPITKKFGGFWYEDRDRKQFASILYEIRRGNLPESSKKEELTENDPRGKDTAITPTNRSRMDYMREECYYEVDLEDVRYRELPLIRSVLQCPAEVVEKANSMLSQQKQKSFDSKSSKAEGSEGSKKVTVPKTPALLDPARNSPLKLKMKITEPECDNESQKAELPTTQENEMSVLDLTNKNEGTVVESQPPATPHASESETKAISKEEKGEDLQFQNFLSGGVAVGAKNVHPF
ncbi:unnamed protein product [Cyprideis torosa]|uniref:Uncharacterized protein n=1 Tax=Cyprideis torosa TaxID=163714 RepID=A0A7R8W1T0_9CRUS|nr:unnamed protein product [Cyprideis torosa]CAG0879100.1 unnamed protein product [Cyprideis torosa]